MPLLHELKNNRLLCEENKVSEFTLDSEPWKCPGALQVGFDSRENAKVCA